MFLIQVKYANTGVLFPPIYNFKSNEASEHVTCDMSSIITPETQLSDFDVQLDQQALYIIVFLSAIWRINLEIYTEGNNEKDTNIII